MSWGFPNSLNNAFAVVFQGERRWFVYHVNFTKERKYLLRGQYLYPLFIIMMVVTFTIAM